MKKNAKKFYETHEPTYGDDMEAKRAKVFHLTLKQFKSLRNKARTTGTPLWQLLNCSSYEDYRERIKQK